MCCLCCAYYCETVVMCIYVCIFVYIYLYPLLCRNQEGPRKWHPAANLGIRVLEKGSESLCIKDNNTMSLINNGSNGGNYSKDDCNCNYTFFIAAGEPVIIPIRIEVLSAVKGAGNFSRYSIVCNFKKIKTLSLIHPPVTATSTAITAMSTSLSPPCFSTSTTSTSGREDVLHSSDNYNNNSSSGGSSDRLITNNTLVVSGEKAKEIQRRRQQGKYFVVIYLLLYIVLYVYALYIHMDYSLTHTVVLSVYFVVIYLLLYIVLYVCALYIHMYYSLIPYYCTLYIFRGNLSTIIHCTLCLGTLYSHVLIANKN
jgi:hypothetical protein